MKIKKPDITKEQLWILIRCCACAGCTLGLVSTCIGLFYTPIAESLGTGRGQIALISTIISLASAVGGQLVARLIKRLPIKAIMTTGVVVSVIGILLLSIIKKLVVMYVIAAFVGLSVVFYSTMTFAVILRSWFGEKSPSKLAVAMAMSGIFAALFNPLLSAIITKAGYEVGLRVMAVLILVISLPAAFTMKMGDAQAVPKAAPAAKEQESSGQSEEVKAPERTKISALLMGLVCVTAPLISVTTAILSHTTAHVVTLGYSLNFGATVMVFQNIFNSLWKLLFGNFAVRFGVIRTNIVYLAMTAAGSLCLALFTGVPVLFPVFISLYAACFSPSTIGVPTLVQKIAKERFAEVYATVAMIQTTAYSIFISLYGTISDKAGNYVPCYLIVSGCAVLCLALNIIIGKMTKIK